MRFFVCFFLFCTCAVFAKDSQPDSADQATETNVITIAAARLSHLVEQDQSSIYQKLFKHAARQTRFVIREIFLPFRRALLEFEHEQVDCTYSFTEVLEQSLGENAIISSFPLGAFSFHIFTRKSSQAINKLSQLANLNIGAVNGQEHYYLDRLPPTLHNKLKLLNTDKQGVDMLTLKRLDAYVGALPDLNPYLESLNYDPKFVLYKSFDRITCHNTSQNQAFLNELSAALEAMKEAGDYQAIAGELYIDF